MKPLEIKPDVFWVGAVDWNKRNFHGYSRSPLGTTYNAYLVKDEKITLFDTVEDDLKEEFFCKISHLVKPEEIDYLVVNHLERDHAGALDDACKRIKPKKIFCSPMGEKVMQSQFPGHDWPVEVVKTGDSISLGKRTVQFLETRMLHWPDSMVSYIPEDKLLISQDAFGQNIASSERFADEYDRSKLEHAMTEYYGNIVLPFSPIVIKTLDKVQELGLDIDMIAPDHGLIFRGEEDVKFVLDAYRRFAEQKPQPKAVIFYDTMWSSTEMMAESIASGIMDEGISVVVRSLKHNHHSRIMTDVMTSGAVVAGSPTHNNGILPLVAGMLQYMKGLKPQNKVGGAFGSFGWSGECVNILTDWLNSMRMDMVDQPVKIKNRPDHEGFKECYDYGKRIAQALKEKIAEFE
jgi:flavorubredoxin